MTAVTWSRVVFVVVLSLLPMLAQAWWNDDWAFRKKITLDTSPTGANLSTSLAEFPILIRLHTGNFAYFLDVQAEGADLRFVAGDDKTPLKYYVERFDPINQLGLIWVKVPRLLAASNSDSIWMYYGNPNVVSGDDPAGTYDKEQALAYGFSESTGAPRDLTAYANNPSAWSAQRETASFIAAGASFAGGQALGVPMSPSLRLVPEAGWTFSAWVKTGNGESTAATGGDAEPPAQAPETGAGGAEAAAPETTGEVEQAAAVQPVAAESPAESVVFAVEDAAGSLILGLSGGTPFMRFTDSAGAVYQTPSSAPLVDGQWHYLTLAAGSEGLTLYLDGAETATLQAPLAELGGDLTVGARADGGSAFVGQIDQVQIAKTRRAPEWIAAAAHVQGRDAALIALGEDEQRESAAGDTYFWTILQNVSTDGWVIIGLLAMMSAISMLVMFVKAFSLSRIQKFNRRFLQDFRRLGIDNASLDADDEDDEEDDAPMLMALFGRHDHYQGSSLYRVYHAGINDVHQRVGSTVGAQAASLSPAALNSVRATIDAAAVRESQRLNSLMVLLTIAISGGPFLGLLGTVMGVMITFAAIAATGDVNINAIAPGVSAALMTTVAGLAVAIPALFGYNYLSTRIRDMHADMQVFADEFIAKAGEHFAD